MTVAIRHAAEGDEVLDGQPGAAAVVAVDVGLAGPYGVAVAQQRAAAEDGREAEPVDDLGQPVVPVTGAQGEQDRAVDMAAAEVVGHARVVVGFLQEQQDGLGAVECEFAADAAQQEVEEGVDEEPVLGLGGDHGDGVRAVGDELPGPLVGDVTQLGDHPADPVDDLRPDPGLPVDHPGHGRLRDSRLPGDVFERGPPYVRALRQHHLRWGELCVHLAETVTVGRERGPP